MPNDFDTSAYPLGSMHPYVLYNNAGNEDLFVNDVVNETWVDRPPFNRVRKTIYGMEKDFDRLIAASGFEMPAIPYAAGVVIDRPSQLISYLGEVYSVSVGATFPYTLNGTFSVDAPNLVQRSEQSLRSDLANASDPTLGAAILARSAVAIDSVFALRTAKQDATQNYLVKSFHPGGVTGGDIFFWSPTTAKSQHNGWRIIDPSIVWDGTSATLSAYLNAVGGAGNGCFVRASFANRAAIPEMAGALTDWNGTTGTNATDSIKALIKDTSVPCISGSGGAYYLGNYAVNELKFVVLRDIAFRWNWSKFVYSGETSNASNSSSLFFFEDSHADIGYFIADDLTYSESILGRGVQAVTICTRTKSVSGHTIGPYHVERGQSVLTCAPLTEVDKRISNIRARGALTFGSSYYGVNLANNGDDVTLSVSGTNVIRAVFVYGVSKVNIDARAARTVPASASILISQYLGSRPTESVEVRAHFGEINGPILIASDSGLSGAGVFKNIDIDLTFDTLGSNIAISAPIVRMGCYLPNSTLMTELGTVTTDNIKISVRSTSEILMSSPVVIYTPSPNHGKWTLGEDLLFEPFGISPVNAAGVFATPTFVHSGRVFQCVTGNLSLSTAKVRIPAKYFLSRKFNQEITTVVRIAARNGVGGSTALRIEEKALLAQVDSSGNITLGAQSSISVLGSGTPAATFTLAVSSDLKFIEVTCAGYTGASGALTVSFEKP